MTTPREIAQQLVDSFNNRTYKQEMSQIFTANPTVVDLATGQENRGLDAAIQSFDLWDQAFPDSRAKLIKHEVDGNTVVTTVQGSGTFTGNMTAPDGTVIPGNGSSFTLGYVQTIDVENGKVARIQAEYDMQSLMSQLGLG